MRGLAVLLLGVVLGLSGCVVYDHDDGHRGGHWDGGRHHDGRWDDDGHRHGHRHGDGEGRRDHRWEDDYRDGRYRRDR